MDFLIYFSLSNFFCDVATENLINLKVSVSGGLQGLREGGSGGTSYPGLGGPGRVQVSGLTFGIAP